MKKLFCMIGLAVGLMACSQMSLTPGPDMGTDKIQFVAGGPAVDYEITTKATVNTATQLTANGFLVTAVKGTPGWENLVWANQLFSKVGDTWEQDKWWPNDNQSYRFYAVYPTNYEMTFENEGSTIQASNADDILCAYKGNAAYKTVNTLSFEHIFARLCDVTVSAVSPYTISSIMLNITPMVRGTYNLYAGAGHTDRTGWSGLSNGNTTNIANNTPGTKSNDIYLVPGTYTVTAAWRATKDNYTQMFTGITKEIELVGGMRNNITVSFTGNGTEIQFGVNVEAWGTEAVDGGEWPLKNPPPSFTINAAGDKVEFSPGNLQYKASTDTWRFAENQWDYVGYDNSNISSTYSGWIDLFGWGTSGVGGYSPIATSYQPWSISEEDSYYNPYGSTSTNLYDGGDNAGKADWGYNTIDNNGNPETGWRTFTKNELAYIFNTRAGGIVGGTSPARWTQGTIRTDVSGVNGIILFPDGCSIAAGEFTTLGTVNSPSNWKTKCTAAQWTALEAKGCVFLPAAGLRGTGVSNVDMRGFYWSSSVYSEGSAWYLSFSDGAVNPQNSTRRSYGFSVRLVKAVN